ncbi:hypothetical protein KFK09_007299 [Dendrobium nobile]|uniref:Uncharacterized protein n=1 Tax=Dendrobium nobile TaxID=94219 RepID=A0A8T3BRP9_DENNO|nr:hypothetical protein KFK09_007299 [Dendrobium nobile]
MRADALACVIHSCFPWIPFLPMDAGEEAIVVPHAIKRRRTKRKRHFSFHHGMVSSSLSSSEEKDMANCLILLAHGHRRRR